MDCRTNEMVNIDDVPVDEHKHLREIPIGKVIVLNGYEYEVARADIDKQEVILKPRGEAVPLPSERQQHQQAFANQLKKMNGKGGLGGY